MQRGRDGLHKIHALGLTRRRRMRYTHHRLTGG